MKKLNSKYFNLQVLSSRLISKHKTVSVTDTLKDFGSDIRDKRWPQELKNLLWTSKPAKVWIRLQLHRSFQARKT